eukprot:20881-Heterococcus_DN1.PRE.2
MYVYVVIYDVAGQVDSDSSVAERQSSVTDDNDSYMDSDKTGTFLLSLQHADSGVLGTPSAGVSPSTAAVSDNKKDIVDSEYSDDSCDENDMMTNVEHVTGFYSRATDSLREGIMHRISLSSTALTEGSTATLSIPESPRTLELRELIRRASELSDTMKTKQYKLIVISNGNGKTSVTNTLCGGMKGVVPNTLFQDETAINIPVQLTSNQSTRAKPHYTVEFKLYSDTAAQFANCNVSQQEQEAWQQQLNTQLQQNGVWNDVQQFDGPEMYHLEQQAKGCIQQFCAAAAVIDAVTRCSYEGAVEYIAVTGPFDMPSDFTVIEMPSLDTMPKYRKQCISTMATSGSAIVYTTVQRPTTADMRAFLQPDTSVYSVNKAMPIAIGYFSNAVITANARGATAASNFTAIGRTTAAAAAALHAASIVDNEDTHLVQQAMYTAVEQVITINSEYERSALAACIENIVLFDRTVLVKDRKVCHKVYEQVRYATSSSTLLQWCDLLSRFCARANGFSAKQTLLNGTKAASKGNIQDSMKQLLLLRGIGDSSSGAGVSQEFEKLLYKAVESSSSSAEAVTAAVQWADVAYELTLKDFAKQVACTLRQAFATAAAAANPQADVKAGGVINSNGSINDSLSMYLQACARHQ